MHHEDKADSALIRSIHLAAAGADHEDVCSELAALRERGWEIRIQGHQRAGELVITITKKQAPTNG